MEKGHHVLIDPPNRTGSALRALLLDGETGTGAGDLYVDLLGFCSKVVVEMVNGAANAAAAKLQGAFDSPPDPDSGIVAAFDPDTATWHDLPSRLGVDAATLTAVPLTGGQVAYVALSGPDIPRYLRANVTDANANGVSASVYAER